MSIYVEKRAGVATGRLVVEVQRNNKKIRKFAGSRREAKVLEAEIRAGLHDKGSSSVETHSGTSLKAFAMRAEHLWEGQGDAKQSVQRFRAFMDALGEVLSEKGLPEEIEAVRTPHISATADKLAGKLKPRGGEAKISGHTLNRYLSAASKAFDWAEHEEIIEQSPKFSWKPAVQKEMFYLTEAQEEAMVSKLREYGHEDCVILMQAQLETGCRISELLGLTPEDIEDDGDGYYRLNLGETKNGSMGVVVMEAELGARFLELVKAGLPSYPSVWKRMKKTRVRCGLPTTQPTHAHRHTVATRLSHNEVEDMRIASFMRHSSLSTTKRYTHHNTGTRKSILKALKANKEMR